MIRHIMMCNVPNAGGCFVPSCACGCHKSTEPRDITTSDYTPTTEKVRQGYPRSYEKSLAEEYAEFDRWLAAHDADVLAAGYRKQGPVSEPTEAEVDAALRALMLNRARRSCRAVTNGDKQ